MLGSKLGLGPKVPKLLPNTWLLLHGKSGLLVLHIIPRAHSSDRLVCPMDKFLCANASSWSSLASSDAEEGGGLLALMKKSREDKAPAASSSSSSSAAPSWSQQHCSVINDAWQSSSSASYSLADVNFQTRHQKLNSNKNSKGWRVINGEKVYVTMRYIEYTAIINKLMHVNKWVQKTFVVM